MNPNNPMLTVTSKGAIVLPNKRLAKPGERFAASLFVGKEEVLKSLLEAELVTTKEIDDVSPIDWSRSGSEQLPAIPGEMDEKKSLRQTRNVRDGAIQARLAKMKARQQALEQAEETGAELTPEQAKAMGLLK